MALYFNSQETEDEDIQTAASSAVNKGSLGPITVTKQLTLENDARND